MGKSDAATLHSKETVEATDRSPLVMGKKLIGCTVITAAILWRLFALDNYSPKLIGDIYYEWMLALPFLSFSLSVLVFLVLGVSGNIKLGKEWVPFLGSVLLWSFAGVGIALVIIILLTAYFKSPEGPFALISDGPLGAAVGIIVGLLLWLLNRKSDYSAS